MRTILYVSKPDRNTCATCAEQTAGVVTLPLDPGVHYGNVYYVPCGHCIAMSGKGLTPDEIAMALLMLETS